MSLKIILPQTTPALVASAMSSSGDSSASSPRRKKMRHQSDSNSDGKSEPGLSTDYSKYVIVAENEFKTPGEIGKSTEVAFHNAHWNIYVTRACSRFRDRRACSRRRSCSRRSCSLHRSGSYSRSRSRSRSRDHSPSPYKPDLDTRVCCDYIFSTSTDFHAEILFLDGKDKTLKIREKFKVGTTTPRYDEYSTSVVIRILEEKNHFVEKLREQWAPDVTFVVNGETCEANRQYLANASPVFGKMLFGKFAEANQSEIVLEGIESAEVFKDFLLAVSPFGVQPNPANVLDLLKLAHQYDVPNLMRKCEEHLKFCYEISIDERIFLAAEYDLNDLKAHTAIGMTNECLKKMWKEHKEKLLKPEFVYLFNIIMDRLK